MDNSEIEAALMRAQEAKARAEKATPGPVDCNGGRVYSLETGEAIILPYQFGVEFCSLDDREFYLEARQDVPALAADVEWLAAALREAQADAHLCDLLRNNMSILHDDAIERLNETKAQLAAVTAERDRLKRQYNELADPIDDYSEMRLDHHLRVEWLRRALE